MEKEKSRMKRVLASALMLSLCSMQAPALALPMVASIQTFENETIANQSVAPNGGAISVAQDAGAIVNNVIFQSNTATESGSAIFTQGDMEITGSKFESNKAMGSGYAGGAIKVNAEGGTVDITGSEFTGNTAENGYAGAIYHSYGDITIDNVKFTGNSAAGSGAVMQGTKAGSLTILNSEFRENTSNKAGGALGIFHGTTIENTKFIDNENTASAESLEGGGAIFLGSVSSLAAFNNVEFEGNKSGSFGGAIGMRTPDKGDNSGAELSLTDVTFKNNEAATYGGAIYSTFEDVVISNANFTGNTADKSGGAIYNEAAGSITTAAATAQISNSHFEGNVAADSGSAIFTNGALTVDNTKFVGNEALGSGYAGGAIKINAKDSTVEITNSKFSGNTADNGYAGAIYHSYGDVTIKDTIFDGNSADGSGAVMQGTKAGLLTIENSTFSNNESNKAGGALGLFNDAKISNTEFINNKNTADSEALEGGGAVFLGSVSNVTAIENVVFKGNTSGSTGGAIGMRDPVNGDNSGASLEISGAIFENNTAAGNGGAVYNTFENTTISKTEFVGNKGVNGGAIYNEAAGQTGAQSPAAGLTVEDVSFTNNSATGQGGAIFANNDVTVNAKGSDVTFSGNSDSNGANDIIMNAAGSTLELNAAEGKSLSLGGGVKSGNDEDAAATYNIAINGATYDANQEGSFDAVGQVVLANTVNNAMIDVAQGTLGLSSVANVDKSKVNVQSGATLDTANNQIETVGSNITLQSGAELKVDIDAATGKGDNFSGANIIADNNGEKNVVINEINAVGETNETNLSSLNIASALGLTDVADVSVSAAAMAQTYTVMTPIRKMNGIIDENGMMTFAPTGNGYRDFNPAVMAAPVAAQLGGYLTQLNAYNQAFHNMDMYMLMTKSQRKALKMAGRVASTSLVGGVEAAHKDNNMWFNPYASYEKVDLNHGPKVENTGYGMFFGGESDLKDLGHGWDGVFGAYVGYNGSHQSYDGVSVYQNGGSLGLVGMAYKDNFFTGLTINTGANAASANTRFGDEDFAMLMAGIASKSGYNFEFKDGKVILQPSLLMSYTMVNTFDYDNGANVNITSDALHAFQLEPGVKLIGNLKNGWQPYAGVSFVWNLFDKAKFQANDVSLPQISVKPYVKYGVGVRKSWGERLTGFFQTYVTNGGRNGVGFQAGFSFAIGKDSGSKVNATGKLPEIKKLELSLKNSNHS